MLQSFAPLIDENTHTLIIGTMPGEASLQAQEYYAYKHNALWKIIAAVYNHNNEFGNYAHKKFCLLSHNTGLWDSLRSCARKGSLDSAINNESPNDFESLLKNYPLVNKFLFNGQKAFAFFKKYNSPLLAGKDYLILPSTSRANATISYSKKLELWRSALTSFSSCSFIRISS